MKVGRRSNAATDSQGTGTEGNIHPDDRRSEQAHLSMADSGARKRWLHNQQDNCEQRPGRPAGQPERRRVPDAGGENLQAIQAELSHQAAIRDIGKLALAFVMADIGAYEKWFFEKYGVKPEL